ncbi:hypothetical protein NLI96_g9019 [Meripilus lineatus]|uniref:Large ribosomal subunit protein mL54 n=1 Tax=Meripilus lineatus TaxID=2056292 RepID=A0AAD5UWB9_9APHY|nr:hypothetical protein NLI96_g9019 [Physisporinus lineatus]
MSLLPVLRRSPLVPTLRCAQKYYATDSKGKAPEKNEDAVKSSTEGATSATGAPKSSCTEGTVLEGLNWLKDQPPVLAQADDAYPDWLWRLLDPKVIPDDGPGGKGEKIKLRIQNRRRIRDQNFMKTQ